MKQPRGEPPLDGGGIRNATKRRRVAATTLRESPRSEGSIGDRRASTAGVDCQSEGCGSGRWALRQVVHGPRDGVSVARRTRPRPPPPGSVPGRHCAQCLDGVETAGGDRERGSGLPRPPLFAAAYGTARDCHRVYSGDLTRRPDAACGLGFLQVIGHWRHLQRQRLIRTKQFAVATSRRAEVLLLIGSMTMGVSIHRLVSCP